MFKLKSLLWHRTAIVLFVLLSANFYACEKEGGEKEDNESQKKVTDLIPAKSVAVLVAHGMPIYEGTNPPLVEGKFKISPYRFDFDNWREPNVYPQPGTIRGDVTLVLTNQKSNQDITLDMPGYYLGENPPSQMFITGEGNNFTICFKTTKVGGPSALFAYPYAQVFSGTFDGDKIRNLKYAEIGLEHTNSSGFSVYGNIDMYSDANGISEKTP